MEWIAVIDRLPEDKPNDPNVFITCDKDGFVYGSHHYFGGGCMDKDGFYSLVNGEWEYDEDVRYWMPLPEAPRQYEMKKENETTNTTKPMVYDALLCAGRCDYYVRFRVVTPDLSFTPMMMIPVEQIKVEYKKGIKDGYMLCVPIGKELNVNPDYVRIEDWQPCA